MHNRVVIRPVGLLSGTLHDLFQFSFSQPDPREVSEGPISDG